jgi:hypothetical protein
VLREDDYRWELFPGDWGFFELELLDPVTDLIAVPAKKARRLGSLVPATELERLHDQ